MAEVVGFDDVVPLAVAYLTAAFAGRSETAHVGSKVPNPRPNRLVRVSAAGGAGRQNLIQDRASLLFECWDTADLAAYDLAKLTRALIDALRDTTAGLTWVADVPSSSRPVFFPDPDTNLPRFQFTAELLIEGAVI